MGYKPALAALAGAAAAAMLSALAFTAPAATAATFTAPETTSFTYAPGSPVLTVAPSSVVPPAGTAVELDVEFTVSNLMPMNASSAQLANELTGVVAALEAAPFNIPAADFTNLPVGDVLPAAGTHTTVTLYSAHATPSSFEVSGVKGGVAITLPASVTVAGVAADVPAGSGMVTWNRVTATKLARPHLLGGHVITVDNNSAQIGWTDGPGVKYVLAKTYGYGFTVNGDPHLGFTGITTGYWRGLAAGHTYDIELIPAGANRQPLPDAQVGWITIVTTR